MRICLIGKNLSNLVLASILANKNLNIDIVYDHSYKKGKSTRTLSISNDNFNFLTKNNKKLKKISAWPIKKIKIFGQKNKSKELFEFRNKEKENFFLIKYSDLFDHNNKYLINFKNVKFLKKNRNMINKICFKKNKYNLIINSDENSKISKQFFYRSIKKKYNSLAYTTIITHEKINNYTATQIFTKYGPLAFLPLSNFKTSIIFSYKDSSKKENQYIINIIKKYNQNYKIKKFSNIEKFELKFKLLRKYYYKNVLSFGDLLHKIHPLAGQGFNMTIRDIKILSNLIDKKISLGLELDNSMLEEFENKTKHLNYIFASGVDFIYEFFKFDNATNNKLSDLTFRLLNKSNYLNKYSTYFADKGLKI